MACELLRPTRLIKLISTAFVVLGLPAGAWWTWDALSESRLQSALSRFRAMGLPESIGDLERVLPAPEENAAFLYMTAVDRAGELERIDSKTFRGPITPELRAAVGAAQPVLAVLEAAAALPRCVYPIDSEDDASTEEFRAGELVGLGRLLAARARIRAVDADLAGALSDVRVLFRAGASLAEEPFLLRQIVRMSIAGIAFDTLEEILPLCESPVEALASVRADVVRGAVERGLRAEAVFLSAVYSPGSDPRMLGDGPAELAPWLLRCRAITSPYVNTEAALALDFLSRSVAALSRPYHVSLPAVEALARQLEEERGLLNREVVMRINGLLEREAKVATRAGLATLAARCISHRSKHEAFPDTLAEIADGAELVDPISGRSFTLSRSGDDLVIASADGEVSWRIPGESVERGS